MIAQISQVRNNGVVISGANAAVQPVRKMAAKTTRRIAAFRDTAGERKISWADMSAIAIDPPFCEKSL